MTSILGCFVLAALLGCWATCGAAEQPFPVLDARVEREAPYRLSTEATFAGLSWDKLEAKTGERAAITLGSFEGRPTGLFARPVHIHYRLYENRDERHGGVVISSGRTEGLSMYQELIHDLVSNGYSVYLHDHRGQGFSSRLLSDPDDRTRGYVDDFDNYVADLDQFVSLVSRRRGAAAGPLYLLAHSMGGAIASLFLESPGSGAISAAALVTPMHEPWATGEDRSAANRIAQHLCDDWMVTLPFNIPFLSKRYVDGKDFADLWREYLESSDRSANALTSSLPRLDRHWLARQAACSHATCASPSAEVGGATLRWFGQACAGSRRSRGEAAGRIQVPVLLIQGGRDTVVDPERQREFCANVNRHPNQAGSCSGYALPAARHAVFIESDPLRNAALSKILSFFDCTRTGMGTCR